MAPGKTTQPRRVDRRVGGNLDARIDETSDPFAVDDDGGIDFPAGSTTRPPLITVRAIRRSSFTSAAAAQATALLASHRPGD